MLRQSIILIMSIVILSIITSVIFMVSGKYVFNETSYGRITALNLFFYYSILLLVIQVATFFWVIYLFSNYLLNKKIKRMIVALIGGTATLGIGSILSFFRVETYYFEPFKDHYQVWIFFFTGFLYPYIYSVLKKLFSKRRLELQERIN